MGNCCWGWLNAIIKGGKPNIDEYEYDYEDEYDGIDKGKDGIIESHRNIINNTKAWLYQNINTIINSSNNIWDYLYFLFYYVNILMV